MSQSGAVYQPTTLAYGAHGDHDQWTNKPRGYLASITQVVRRPCGLSCSHPNNHLSLTIILISCIVSFTLGFVLLIHGAVGYSNIYSDLNIYLVITIFGAIFFSVGLLLLVYILRVTRRACWRNSKNQSVTGAQALSVNPSTDFLVSAQYAPVSEVTYCPEDSEQGKLMIKENRDLISNEDTDRMMENDPRIVLRPLNPSLQEET